MKAAELRAIRHMALSIAEQCAGLLELVDSAMPTDPPAADPAKTEEAPTEVIAASDGLPPMLGARGRTQTAEAADATTPATGTDDGKASD